MAAHALLFFEKIRLIREENQANREALAVSRKHESITNNIKNREKYFTSLFTKLDQEYKRLQNSAGQVIQYSLGLTNGNFNPYGGNFNQITPLAYNVLQNICISQGMQDGKYEVNSETGQQEFKANGSVIKFDANSFNKAYANWMQNGYLKPAKTETVDGKEVSTYDGFDESKAQLFTIAMNNARNYQAQMQQFAQVQTAAHV